MTLFDQFGRPIKTREAKRPETREISSALVRDRWSSYPSKGLTPVRLARILESADNGDVLRQAELFEEMEEKDPHLSSQLQTRKMAVQGLDYELSPGDKKEKNNRILELCQESLNSLIDFDEYVLDALDAIGKGYSMQEIDWDVSTGQAVIQALRWVHPRKVTFWDSLTPRVLTDSEPVQGIDPPPWKFVYHRYKARSGYDTRGGVLRVCAWMYLFKNYSIKDWVAFAEVFGMPLRIGKYDQGASQAEKDALIQAVRSLGSDAAGIISKATEIEFVEATKTGSLNIYESLADFCDKQMSKAILGQTLTSDSGSKGSGSYALGKIHGEVRHDLVKADAKSLAKTIQRQILRPLVGFNFGWDAPVPRFRFIVEEPEDLEKTAQTYKTVIKEIGLDVSQEHLSERFGIPMRKDSETPVLQKGQTLKRQVLKSELPGEDPSRTLNVLGEKTLEGIDFGPMMEPVEDLLAEAESLEDFRDKLLELFENMDESELGNLMQQAFTLAELSGRFDAA